MAPSLHSDARNPYIGNWTTTKIYVEDEDPEDEGITARIGVMLIIFVVSLFGAFLPFPLMAGCWLIFVVFVPHSVLLPLYIQTSEMSTDTEDRILHREAFRDRCALLPLAPLHPVAPDGRLILVLSIQASSSRRLSSTSCRMHSLPSNTPLLKKDGE